MQRKGRNKINQFRIVVGSMFTIEVVKRIRKILVLSNDQIERQLKASNAIWGRRSMPSK